MERTTLVNRKAAKQPLFGMDKICGLTPVPQNADSLVQWANLYFAVHVLGSPKKTETAKRKDLEKFLAYFQNEMGTYHVDGWTPAVSRQYQKQLQRAVSQNSGQRLKATTVNRHMATVRHFGRWLHKQRPLLAGDPMARVKDIAVDAPDWNGLTARQLMRIKAACEQRLKSCTKGMQDPVKEAAAIHVLLHTGLRAAELCALDLNQYHHRGFHNVLRKGKRVSAKLPLPAEARVYLDRYIKQSRGSAPGPLFISQYGNRLAPQDLARICTRIANQACTHLDPKEQFKLTPHMFRHTFLKRVADKHGVHYAQQMSGNISIREIFRYTKPSDQEIAEDMETLFD